jgi:hypothetical protein
MAVDGKGYFGRGDELYAAPAQRLDNIGKLRTEMGDSAISKLPEFQLSRWLDKPKVVGVEKVDGVQATHVTGELAAGSVARDIVRVLSIGDTGGPGSVPGNTTAIAKKSVENARLDAWVGPDRIARRLKVSVAFDAPKGLREPGDTARWTGDLDVRLTNVNKPQEIAAPDVKAGAAAKGLGKENADSGVSTLSSLAMGLDAPGGVVGTTYTVMSLYRLGQSNEVAKKVLRAVANGKETVVFFRNPKALDDDATAESVAYLKDNSKKLVVFTDDVVNTERYGRLVENLGVTQAPAIVFINRRGRASLVEGYVDGPSLAQVVADAR